MHSNRPIGIASHTSSSRSHRVNCGRFTCRAITMSCCRSSTFSSIKSALERILSVAAPIAKGACVVENPHLWEDSSSIAGVVVQDASKYVPTTNDTVWETQPWNWSLLVDPLMRTSASVIPDVFLPNTDEMTLIDDEQRVQTCVTN
jgi:hypothetical protein